MANIYDYINNVADDDGLVTGINYNMQESPTTSAYHQIAAQDNPDYAQAIGDVYRLGDINRSNFNLGMNVLAGLNNKKYLENIQKEQRAYAEQLADKKFEQQKELLKLKSMFDLRNLTSRLAAPKATTSNNTYINSKGEIVEKPQNYKYTMASEMEKRNIPTINEFYNTEGFNGVGSTDLDLNQIKQEANNLNMMRLALLDPNRYPGTSKEETQYMLDKLFNNYIQRADAFNKQAEQYQNSAALNDSKEGKNYISNQISINDPDNQLKNELLKEYVTDNNAQIPTAGWESTPETQLVYQYLINNNIDLTNRYPINTNDDIVLYNTETGTIESLVYDDQGNIQIQPIQQIEQPTTWSEKFKNAMNTFDDLRFYAANSVPYIAGKIKQNPNIDKLFNQALEKDRANRPRNME